MSEAVDAAILRLRAAYEVNPSEDKLRALAAALERMPEEVIVAAVGAHIDHEDKFPTVAALNRAAEPLGWTPPKASVATPEERAMMSECRQRFAEVFGTGRTNEPADLEYFGLLVSFRWAVRHGTWARVKARLGLMGPEAARAASHVEAEVASGKLEPAIRQGSLV